MSTNRTPTFGKAIEDYVTDQRRFGRMNGKNTALAYRSCLRRHHEDVGTRGPLETTRDDVKQTLTRWSGNTQYRNHSVLLSFYSWLEQEGMRIDNPARQVRRTKLHRSSVYRLTRAEAMAIMDAAATPRERRVVYIGLLTGARVGELAQMQIRHLERPGWVWFSADISKGNRERWVPVLPELEPIIAEIGENVSPLAFVIPSKFQRAAQRKGTQPQALSRTVLARMVKAVARRAGIAASIHPHLLRHSFGDHIARHAGLRAAQALMGHESVETTARVYVDRPGLDELALSVQDFRYRDEEEA